MGSAATGVDYYSFPGYATENNPDDIDHGNNDLGFLAYDTTACLPSCPLSFGEGPLLLGMTLPGCGNEAGSRQ